MPYLPWLLVTVPQTVEVGISSSANEVLRDMTYPSSDLGVPADDALVEEGMRPDHGTAENRRVSNSHSVLDAHPGTKGHVRPDFAVDANTNGRVLIGRILRERRRKRKTCNSV